MVVLPTICKTHNWYFPHRYHACLSRILGFLLLLVPYIGLQKNLSAVGYEMTTRFSDIVCVSFSFLVLSWFKIKLLFKTKNCRKQISYSRHFVYPSEISHRKKTRFFKIFSLVFGWFLPFFTRTIGHVLLRSLEESSKMYFLV